MIVLLLSSCVDFTSEHDAVSRITLLYRINRGSHYCHHSEATKVRFLFFRKKHVITSSSVVVRVPALLCFFLLTPRRIVASISRLEDTTQLRPRLCPVPCHSSPRKPLLRALADTEVLGATKPSVATIWQTHTPANSSAVSLLGGAIYNVCLWFVPAPILAAKSKCPSTSSLSVLTGPITP